jgi:hypothetical protein
VKLSSPQKLSSPCPWLIMFFLLKSHPIYDQTHGFSVVFLTL